MTASHLNCAICRTGPTRAKGEEMSEARLQELEEMAATLLATALNFSGYQSDDALLKVESFRAQIAALESAERAKK